MRKRGDQEEARQYAFRLLSFRDRSRKELADKLKQKKITPEVIRETMSYLEKLGLLNDERFGRLWVRSRLDYHPRSPRLIRRELEQKGLEGELADRIMAEEIGPGREETMARDLVRKRMVSYRRDGPEASRRKLFSYLARRGFPPDLIQSIINEIHCDELPED